MSEETYQERVARAEPRFGDLLYSREGTYFGIAAEVPPDFRVCLGQRMVLIRPNRNCLHHRFLRYWLNSPVLAAHVHGFRHGSVAERLNLPAIRGLAVPIAPLPEQRAIAHILGSLDDKIELNRRMNETLEAMARALFRSWFRSWFVDFDPVRIKARGGDPVAELGLSPEIAALFPDSFEDSELGEIPAGWKPGRFGDIALNRRRPAPNHLIDPDEPYVGLEHMPRGSIALREWGKGGDVSSQKARFVTGEILFGKLRPYFHKVIIAPVSGICSTDVLVLDAQNSRDYGQVAMTASDALLIEHAVSCSDGTRMPRTSWADLAKFPIVIPRSKVGVAFTEVVNPFLLRLRDGAFEQNALAETRDYLLPKLLSGEISGLEQAGAVTLDAFAGREKRAAPAEKIET